MTIPTQIQNKVSQILSKQHPVTIIGLVILSFAFIGLVVIDSSYNIPRNFSSENLGFTLRYVPQKWKVAEHLGLNTVFVTRNGEYRAKQFLAIQIKDNSNFDCESTVKNADSMLQCIIEGLSENKIVLDTQPQISLSKWKDTATARVQSKDHESIPNGQTWLPETDIIVIRNGSEFVVVYVPKSGFDNHLDEEAIELVESITVEN